MTDEINEQEAESQQSTEEESSASEQPAAAKVAADSDGWHTELVLESQRYVLLLTAPDGTKHVAHSEDEAQEVKAAYGK